jgi:hypothetical protein
MSDARGPRHRLTLSGNPLEEEQPSCNRHNVVRHVCRLDSSGSSEVPDFVTGDPQCCRRSEEDLGFLQNETCSRTCLSGGRRGRFEKKGQEMAI